MNQKMQMITVILMIVSNVFAYSIASKSYDLYQSNNDHPRNDYLLYMQDQTVNNMKNLKYEIIQNEYENEIDRLKELRYY